MTENTSITDLQQRQEPQTPKNFPAMLKSFQGEIEKALPKHLSGDRMARIALTAFRRTPMLAKCDPRSVFAAVIQASQLGLEPDTLGRAYLIPYKNHSTGVYECQFIPGWKGLVELLNRSGQGTAWTGAVFMNDEFDYMLGDSPFVHHKPGGEYDPEKLTHVYAIGRPKGAEWPVIEVWPMERVTKHRDQYNKVGQRHYSYKNMEMYARKVVLLQVLKYMPASPELTTAVELDTASQGGGQNIGLKDAIEGTWAPVPDDDQEEDVGAADSEQKGWPREVDGKWMDSAGAIYNPDTDGWSKADNRPAVKTNGTFKARRGTGAKVGKPDETLEIVIGKMKAATTEDQLNDIIDLAREFSEKDKADAGAFYDARVKQIQEGGDFGGME
ncbi:MAG TPA: recombinase RecT [Gammaproteobacteria bacterium]|nr:recombinase RecT [Gammaproteobacteria bacterium]